MSIRNRFFVFAGIVLLAVTAGAVLLVRHRLADLDRTRAARELASAAEVAERIAAERAGRLAVEAELLAEVLPLAEAIESGGADGISELVERFAARRRGLSWLQVYGPAGEPLTGAGSRGPARLPAAGAEGTLILDRSLLAYAARPVREPASGEALGWVAVGEEIGFAAAESLARLTGTDVVVLAGGVPVASTLPLGTDRQVLAIAGGLDPSRQPGSPEAVEIGREPFLARLSVLRAEAAGGAAPGQGPSGLLLLRSLGDRHAAAALVARDVALTGTLGLLLAAPFLWLGSRRFHRALGDLTEVMATTATTGRLTGESLGGSAGRWAGPEVEELRAAFGSLMKTVEESFRDRERSYVEAVGAVVAAVDARDHETTGHSFRVADYALVLGRALGLEADQVRALEWGALLHDVGKIAVPDAILRKSGRLTEEEWHVMRQHPSWGFEMLADVKFLEPALEVVYSHHERWDGGGYPRGLQGAEIPLAARIFAVADTYDSITSDRPYRRARGHSEAVTELCRVAGTQLDPAVVEAFIRISEVDLRRLRERSGRLVPRARLPEVAAPGVRVADAL